MQTMFHFIIIFLVLLCSNTLQPLANTISLGNHNIIKANDSDYGALFAIKAEIITTNPNSIMSSWNNSLHFCKWLGVTCGPRNQHVVILDLSSSNLRGKLSPSISNLTFLQVLVLRNNSFGGNIPQQISLLPRLRYLSLGINSFEGEIPSNLSLCLNLTTLDLGQNNLVGRIPYDFGRLKYLTYLNLWNNTLVGTIPSSLFNLSSLQTMELGNNNLTGSLPKDLGLKLPQLRIFGIMNNLISGQLPSSLSNLSELLKLEISHNNFLGSFSFNGNNSPNLTCIDSENAFSMGDLSFLDTLTNCTNLHFLYFGGNSFGGVIPPSILNLSSTLQRLSLWGNRLVGRLPYGLGKFTMLFEFLIHNNYLSGPIPSDIGMLKSMQRFMLSYNNFSGEIPSSMGSMNQLSLLYMDHNNFEGSIPKSFGYCKSLQYLSFYSNKLSGVLPSELFDALSLINLWIGYNNIQGSFPNEINKLKSLVLLDVSQNKFSGEIPSTLGECTGLTTLNLSRNSFVGSIPDSLSPLKSITSLDLSRNNLSGKIPSYFTTWPFLSNLNLSFNHLEGEIPSGEVFANTSIVSIQGNNKLCGGENVLQLPKCPSHKRSYSKIMIITFVCVLATALSLALCFYVLCLQREKKDSTPRLQDIKKPFLDISYQMVLRATNRFSSTNLIGVGGFGSVYKGILHQGDTKMEVAVKVLNHQNKGASKSFITECNTLKNIRHRNLVRIITACSSIDSQLNDFKALVYEFMPKGSLESWLYSNHLINGQSCALSLFQRLSIANDVAIALEYLHVECANSIVHCDLKPSNILLSDDMMACVSDFGLAKFLLGDSTSNFGNSSTQVRGTVGYTAPEYGLGSNISMEGDIYSFGIIVLEMMISRRPTDPMFNNGLNLHDFAKSALPDQAMEIIDRRMLVEPSLKHGKNDIDIWEFECIKSLIMIGVQCSREVPRERMNIKDVITKLKTIKETLVVM